MTNLERAYLLGYYAAIDDASEMFLLDQKYLDRFIFQTQEERTEDALSAMEDDPEFQEMLGA